MKFYSTEQKQKSKRCFNLKSFCKIWFPRGCRLIAAVLCGWQMSTALAAPPQALDLHDKEFWNLGTVPIKEERTLLLSDSPEYVEEAGIVSAGTIKQKGRIYFYHVNNMGEDGKIAIVAKNLGTKPAELKVTRQLVAEPSTMYFKVGRDLSEQEAKVSKQPATLTMQPKTRQLLFQKLEEVVVKPEELTSGILDFTTTQPVFVQVMMVPKAWRSLGASYTSPTLPIDRVELRGTFEGADRTVTTTSPYNTVLGPTAITLANDREDMYLTGIDELTEGKAVKDYGNYGVAYTILLDTAGEGSFAMYFNPLGGAYAGAIRILEVEKPEVPDGKANAKEQKQAKRKAVEKVMQPPALEEGKVLLVPDMSRAYLGDGTVLENQYLGTFKAGKTLQISFMPAGASNLPVRLLLIPWQEQENKQGNP